MKWAFAGAVTGRSEDFERADKGTIFLDEVGELPLEAMKKLKIAHGKKRNQAKQPHIL